MTKRRVVVGVMGRGETARPEDMQLAEDLGERIAAQGWVLLTGGRDAGVMDAASRGAKRIPGSLTLGVLPGSRDRGVSAHVDIAIFTGMGDARNAINVLSSDVVIVCGACGPGTLSEAALALKSQRPLVLLGVTGEAATLLTELDPSTAVLATAEQVVTWIELHIAQLQR